ncbi:MAG: flagellar motor protein MotB [Armatimonadetes bacterium]|jgi:chemotaxis protein MotB|nr:flagellar motor protein MotB [Armatimonadota bacterium]
MRKKKADSGHENSERWLLTYADMITLLMAFFIMMYSMSVLNLSKFREAAVSIRSGFGGIVSGQGKSILGTTGSFSPKPSPMGGDTTVSTWQMIDPLIKYIKMDPQLKQNARVTIDNRGVVISMLSDNMLFDSGRADIREHALPLLNKIAELLVKIDNNVRVEGHTCNLPPRLGGRYPTNWELSTARATNVLRYLVEDKGLNAAMFSAAGYAGTHPVATNDSEANRRKNRRVDIVILAREDIAPPPPAIKPDIAARAVAESNKASNKNTPSENTSGAKSRANTQTEQRPGSYDMDTDREK